MNGGGLSYQFKQANVMMKLIVINVALFLVIRVIAFLMQVPPESLVGWLVLPEAPLEFGLQPWSFITYSFLHFGFWHIFWNMLVLYWFGQYVLNLFTAKRFLTIYLLGAISGGLLYVLAYNIFPAFAWTSSYLIGASGAVRAIMIFIAAYSPNSEARIFMFNIKLWHIGAFVVLTDIFQLTSGSNAGGMLAHLGGAAFGYVYARQLVNGRDIGTWFERIMDSIADLFKSRKEKPFKKVHRNRATPAPNKRSTKTDDKDDHQKKVDAILDKIGKSGYDSLSKAEKDFLFKAGKK